jgi:hypothetical protein
MIVGLYSVTTGTPTAFSLFGIDYKGSMLHPIPIMIAACFGFFSYSAYSLLLGRKEGCILGLASGYLGVVIVVVGLIVNLMNGRLSLHLEPLLQVPFVVALHRRRAAWERDSAEPSDLYSSDRDAVA